MKMTVEAVTLGKFVRAVGLKGEVKFLPGPDFWPRALDADRFDLISDDAIQRTVQIENVRAKGGTFILRLSGITVIDLAESVVGNELVISLESLDKALMPPEPLPCQLMGLEVRLEDGSVKGQIADLLLGSDQKCFIVDNGSERFLVPNVPEVVKKIDIEDGFMIVDPPEGLFDLEY
jgi:16S rRNA processing protein RimM